MQKTKIGWFVIYFAPATGTRKFLYKNYGSMQTRDNFTNIEYANIWALDNGAWSDYFHKNVSHFKKLGVKKPTPKNCNFVQKKFNAKKFLWRMNKMANTANITAPQFVVLPDIVTGGLKSLKYSEAWHRKLKKEYPQFKYYLALQDGMQICDIETEKYDGLFLGGSRKWKLKTAQEWVEFAKKNNIKIHIGGIGSAKLILIMKMMGADSVDSGLAFLHPHHFKDILNIEKHSLFWNIEK